MDWSRDSGITLKLDCSPRALALNGSWLQVDSKAARDSVAGILVHSTF